MNKGKNKGYKPVAAPPVPTLYNPWTGAIQMWTMSQPAGHSNLEPRPGVISQDLMLEIERQQMCALHSCIRKSG
jgi:hypothetical protein